MLTTKKEFYEKVQQHIIDGLNEDNGQTIAEQLQAVADEFAAYYCPYKKRLTPNAYAAFIDFLNGLPSCLSVEFTYYNQRQTLREWHEQTEEQASRYSDDQVTQNYMRLIVREFAKLCRKYNIERNY